MFVLVALKESKTSKDIVDNYRDLFKSRMSAGVAENYFFLVEQLYKVATPCMDDHQFKEEEISAVGESSKVCSQIDPKCLYLARIGRPDFLWSVNKLARSITKWTKACDKIFSIDFLHSSHK